MRRLRYDSHLPVRHLGYPHVPYVALGLDLGPQKFSILAGIAINDVASVTAAALHTTRYWAKAQ